MFRQPSIWICVGWLAAGASTAVWSSRTGTASESRAHPIVILLFWPIALAVWGMDRAATLVSNHTPLQFRTFDDLILIKSWRGSLALIVGASLLLFFLFGFWWPYWRVADMDFWMVYEAWLLGGGLPQEWFDHPGYLSILLLGNWFRFLNAVGLLDAYSFAAATTAADPARAWTTATQAGRLLSLILSMSYVLVFAGLLRVIVKDWRIAILAALLLAFSGGLTMSERIMRTELIAGGALSIAFLLLVIAARSEHAMRTALVGFAAFVATLGLINKVQVLPMACALSVMAIPFGKIVPASGTRRPSARTMLLLAALAIVAAAVALPAGKLILFGISQAPAAGWPPFLAGTYGAYQFGVAIGVVASVVAFALIWRIPPMETVAALLCLLLGISLAVLTLELRSHPMNVAVIANPLEQLFAWAKTSNPENTGLLAMIHDLARGFVAVFWTRTFIFDSSARPTIFLEWLVIAGAFVAWRSGKRLVVLQVALLMFGVWGSDAVSGLRGLKQQYFILSDPFVVIAAALLLAEIPALRAHRYAVSVGALLIGAHVGVGLAEPIKHTFLTSKPMDFCVDNFAYTKRIKRFPFCPPAGG